MSDADLMVIPFDGGSRRATTARPVTPEQVLPAEPRQQAYEGAYQRVDTMGGREAVAIAVAAEEARWAADQPGSVQVQPPQ